MRFIGGVNCYNVRVCVDDISTIPTNLSTKHYVKASQSYVHRSGRTARAQKQGLTLLLIEPAEVQYYVKLCSTLGKSQELPLFPIENNALNVVKKRVALAREVDRLELASRRSTSETGWFRKALTEMDMLVDEDDLPRQLDDDECIKNRRVAGVKRKQLEALLSKPLFKLQPVDILKQMTDQKYVKSKHK